MKLLAGLAENRLVGHTANEDRAALRRALTEGRIDAIAVRWP